MSVVVAFCVTLMGIGDGLGSIMNISCLESSYSCKYTWRGELLTRPKLLQVPDSPCPSIPSYFHQLPTQPITVLLETGSQVCRNHLKYKSPGAGTILSLTPLITSEVSTEDDSVKEGDICLRGGPV